MCLECVPSLPTGDPHPEPVLTSKAGQVNWCPSLVTQGVSRSSQQSLHCTLGAAPSYRSSSLVASLHLEVPHTIVGGKLRAGADGWPIKNGVRRWGLFGSSQQMAGVTAAWIHASGRRWVRHGFLSIKDTS